MGTNVKVKKMSSKFIKVTNNREDMKGVVINFNVDHITCFYDVETTEGIKTFIFGGPGQSWDIEESSSKILKLIEESVEK